MAGPFAREGSRVQTTTPTPGVTVTETAPGAVALQNNAASWVLVWGLILVGIALASGVGKNFYLTFIDRNATAPSAAAEIILGALFTGALTLVSAFSDDAANLALMFEFAVSLMLVYNLLDSGGFRWLAGITAQATANHTPAKK